MPVYEYKCPRCEKHVTAVRPMSHRDAYFPCYDHEITNMQRVLTTPATVHVQIAKGSYDTRVRNPTGRVLK